MDTAPRGIGIRLGARSAIAVMFGAALLFANGTAGVLASSGGTGSFQLGGQVKGKLGLNANLSCVGGTGGWTNPGTGNRQITLVLIDHGTRPTDAHWTVELHVINVGTSHLSLSQPDIAGELDITARDTLIDGWLAVSGAISVASDWKSGSVEIRMSPKPSPEEGHADGSETIKGRWTCG